MDIKKREVNLQTTFLKTDAMNPLIKFKYHSTIQKSLWEIINNKKKKIKKKENKNASLSQEETEHTNLLIYLET